MIICIRWRVREKRNTVSSTGYFDGVRGIRPEVLARSQHNTNVAVLEVWWSTTVNATTVLPDAQIEWEGGRVGGRKSERE